MHVYTCVLYTSVRVRVRVRVRVVYIEISYQSKDYFSHREGRKLSIPPLPFRFNTERLGELVERCFGHPVAVPSSQSIV